MPLGEAITLPGAKPDERRILQYFEGAVLEFDPKLNKHPQFGQLEPPEQIKIVVAPHEVGVAYTAGRIKTSSGNSVAEPFRSFYNSIAGSWRLGSPITGPMTEDLGDGPTTVQYFRRGRLQINARTKVVEVGNLGRWAWEAQCASAPER